MAYMANLVAAAPASSMVAEMMPMIDTGLSRIAANMVANGMDAVVARTIAMHLSSIITTASEQFIVYAASYIPFEMATNGQLTAKQMFEMYLLDVLVSGALNAKNLQNALRGKTTFGKPLGDVPHGPHHVLSESMSRDIDRFLLELTTKGISGEASTFDLQVEKSLAESELMHQEAAPAERATGQHQLRK